MNNKVIYLDNTGSSFVPEVIAYKEYLENLGYTIIFHKGDIQTREYLAIIKFPSTRLTGIIDPKKVIVDYNSLSIGKFKYIKDVVKQIKNLKYSKFFFLNSYVKSNLPILSGKRHLIRDMGCSDDFFHKPSECKKEFDICYIGSIEGRPGLKQVILKLAGSGFSLCVMGLCHNSTKNLLNEVGVYFEPIGSSCDVLRVLKKSKFGLNFIPDLSPFNKQTSTKLLEYCASGLPVISNKYPWAEDFCRDNNINVTWLDDINSILDINRRKNFLDSGLFGWDALFDRIELENFILNCKKSQ
jgi:hypothetical protein